METNNESKEFLLIKIEETAIWRAQKAEQYPQDREINLHANSQLMELYSYIEKLPDNHQIFYWYLGSFEEKIKELIENELRRFGYQNKNESPANFVDRLVSIGINDGLIDRILDNPDFFP